MACSRCNQRNCNGGPSCGQGTITRENNFSNNSIGRDGETAYQIAVRLGFQGTEQEWIDSLKGEDGTSIKLKGNVPLYSDLANITPTPEIGDLWAVEEDGRIYAYGEAGFPTKGNGILISGIKGDSYIPEETSNYFDI